eukprot:1343227-Rhodomonas_salina.1
MAYDLSARPHRLRPRPRRPAADRHARPARAVAHLLLVGVGPAVGVPGVPAVLFGALAPPSCKAPCRAHAVPPH